MKQLEQTMYYVNRDCQKLKSRYQNEKDIMVFTRKINTSKRAYILYLAPDKDLPAKEIVKQCFVSLATVYRIKQENLIDQNVLPQKKRTGGRPKKLVCKKKENS